MDQFEKQFQRIQEGKGFIAALDQSGGSTPKALLGYGIKENVYSGKEEMYRLIHEMRVRVMKDPSFTGDKILGVILFEKTMNGFVDSVPVPEFLWRKNIVPFLKIDKGLKKIESGVKLMKEIPTISERLQDAKSKGIFGTKMRAVIYAKDEAGIIEIAKQQFEVAKVVLENGLIPIIEPEVDINADDKVEIETILREALLAELDKLSSDQNIILKLTLPTEADYYTELIQHENVIRVLALSGGYSRDTACRLLTQNHGMIASFSRALLDDLKVKQSPDQFSKGISTAIEEIYQASIT
ncbi:fructose bisphosphate aldolase [Algoriphagus antarcticus]|uniref:fructose-bisphosphate aldolase n=1 Tax=Algoriphagus antarcticus TaxID=238540 RepID=A0A3E0DGZ7_9BACT|nr:fructose bisphosphate aldolase [Algoriphagus antarcticus]REG81071.1 fructose-bisphosphate aldolase class I [Algoriphagus antarcticus]